MASNDPKKLVCFYPSLSFRVYTFHACGSFSKEISACSSKFPLNKLTRIKFSPGMQYYI